MDNNTKFNTYLGALQQYILREGNSRIQQFILKNMKKKKFHSALGRDTSVRDIAKIFYLTIVCKKSKEFRSGSGARSSQAQLPMMREIRRFIQ